MPTSQLGYFSKEHIIKLRKAYKDMEASYRILVLNFDQIHLDGTSKEYMDNGLYRRIYTLKKCINNIYTTCPPDSPKIPEHDDVTDVGINLQSYYINMYGAFENMARICIEESSAEMAEKRKARASFLSKNVSDKIKNKLPKNLCSYFDNKLDCEWLNTLESFRHSLAHRIPLYVPRYSVPKENEKEYNELNEKINIATSRLDFNEVKALTVKQEKLVVFVPMTTHSFGEKSPGILFHAQVIADWNTLIEFFCIFLDEVSPPIGGSIRKQLTNEGITLA